MSLRLLQRQWLKKWDEMHATVKRPHITLAAPFLSVGTYPTLIRSEPTIMMVGKATHKDWYIKLFMEAKEKSPTERIEERKGATIDFLDFHAASHRGAFWALYRDLQKATGANMIWTNVAKIGVCRPPGENNPINPWGPFLRAQEKLAQDTLIAEMQEYVPDLVLIVTADYALAEVVSPVFCSDGKWEKKFRAGNAFWILQRSANRPPVLRTGHPGFKTREERTTWINAAEEMLS